MDEVCADSGRGHQHRHHPRRIPLPRPAWTRPARAAVEAACAQGGTSIHSTGSSPGFITEAVPLALDLDPAAAGPSGHQRIRRSVPQRDSPALLFQVMGFGAEPGGLRPSARPAYLADSFGPSLRLVASALGLPLDTLPRRRGRSRGGNAAAHHRRRRDRGGNRCRPAGDRHRHQRDGRPLVTFRATWYCTADVEPAWDVRPTGWRITVDGDAPLDVDLRFPFPLERMAELSPGYTANRAVNAVPFVCDAAPGHPHHARPAADHPVARRQPLGSSRTTSVGSCAGPTRRIRCRERDPGYDYTMTTDELSVG